VAILAAVQARAVLAVAPPAQPRVGVGQMTFLEMERYAPMDLALTDGGVGDGLVCRGNSKGTPNVWSDANTRGNILKTTRALKTHILKQCANTTQLLGVGSKTLSMVFTLKKFPSSLKAVQIELPHALGHPAEGLFLKTARGQKILSVQFARGDMHEDALLQNAVVVANAVRTSVDVRLVREMLVSVDRLALPVWNRKLWDRVRKKLPALPRHLAKSLHTATERGSMGPPVGPPLKKTRNM